MDARTGLAGWRDTVRAQFNQYLRDNMNMIVRPVAIVTTETDVVDTTAEIDLLNSEVTIPGGYMGTMGSVRGTLLMDYYNAAGTPHFTFNLSFGGQTLYSDQSINIPSSSVGRHPVLVRFMVANLGAADQQFGEGSVLFGAPGGAIVGIGNLGNATTGADGPWFTSFASDDDLTVDTSGDTSIRFTVQHNISDVDISMRLKYASFELVGQGGA